MEPLVEPLLTLWQFLVLRQSFLPVLWQAPGDRSPVRSFARAHSNRKQAFLFGVDNSIDGPVLRKLITGIFLVFLIPFIRLIWDDFSGFEAILMAPVSRTGYLKSVWYRKCVSIRSGA